MTTRRQSSIKRAIAAMRSLKAENALKTADSQEAYTTGRRIETVNEYHQVMYDFLQNSKAKVFDVELAPGLREKLAVRLILDEEQRTSEEMEPRVFTFRTQVTSVQEIREAIQNFKLTHLGQGILNFICSPECEEELKTNPTLCAEPGLAFISGDRPASSKVQ